MLSRQTRCTIVLRMSAHTTASFQGDTRWGPARTGKFGKVIETERQREREEEGAPVAERGRGARFDRRARSRPATGYLWPTSRVFLRNVAQKCCAEMLREGNVAVHILGGWVPRWDFYTDGRKKKMKKMERVAAGGGSAKKKNTERSIEPPSGKANWLMVRAPHLKQRDAKWSATTGTTKVVGGAMADGRESGAPEGPSPEHEPPLFSVFFFLSRGRRLPRKTQETLDRRGGPLGVDGTLAARAVPRPSCSVPAPRLVVVVVVVVVVSSSFFFFFFHGACD